MNSLAMATNVARGARLLDKNRPRWWTQIDLSKLDMKTTTRDVVGQLGDGKYEGVWQGVSLGLPDPMTTHGFDIIGETEDALDYDDEYAALTELWKVEIRRRLDTVPYYNGEVDSIVNRDREWMEAIHPGNSDTQLGRSYGTPKEYAVFRQAVLDLERETLFHSEKQIRKLTKKLKKARATIRQMRN